jgi:hypothetical protein
MSELAGDVRQIGILLFDGVERCARMTGSSTTGT